MPRKSKSRELADIHADALAEFDEIQSAQRDMRLSCLDARRFCSVQGAQWDGPAGEQYENRVRLELNLSQLAVKRVFNEYRNNRIAVDFTPSDGAKNDALADMCDGLYRADEYKSGANEAYDNAFDEGVTGGIGAWRVRAAYEDEYDPENEKQRCVIEPIFDADTTVFYDLGAKRQDRRDAKRCYVLTSYTREAYEEEWGDDPASWPKEITRTEFDWCTPDVVWVCERYEVEEVKDMRFKYAGLTGQEMSVLQSELDAEPGKAQFLMSAGFRVVGEKAIKRRKVRKIIMSGGKVLEDCGHIAGTEIPIVMFAAQRVVVNGVEHCFGHVHLAKDAQRLYNMLLSWLAEQAARFDIEKPILTPEQVGTYGDMWADDAVKRFPFLLLNPVKDADGQPVLIGPQAYTKAPSIPPAMAALTELARQALSDLLGNQQSAEEIMPNVSGKAIELVQNRLDMQTFIYMSNFAKAMKRSGEVWLSIKKEITPEKSRKMKTVGPNGEMGQVVVNQPALDKDGTQTIKHDMSKLDMEIVVDVGPATSSKRSATVRAVTALMGQTADPEITSILAWTALQNIEGEGMSEINALARKKLLRLGAAQPTEEESKEMEQEQQNQQPDPQSLYLMKAAEAEEAKAAKTRADTVQSIATADLKRAQTLEVLANTDGAEQDQQISAIDAAQRIFTPPANGGD